jgi:DNA-binding beta-propeller fold protein YncE
MSPPRQQSPLVSGGLRAMLALIAFVTRPFVHVAFTQPMKPPPPVLRTVGDIPLPGPAVRFDYQSLDTASNRLYIAHMNAGQLVVFDVAARRVAANLDGFDRVHGVLAVPSIGRVYASVTGRKQVAVLDAASLAVLALVPGVLYPDGIAYAPDAKRVFVSDERGRADGVIDATTNAFVRSIPLGGEAGNTVYDPTAGRILVAVHGSNELVSIDPATAAITGHWPLPGIEDPHGIAVDPAHGLAFVAGEGNAKLAVVDLSTMHVIAVHALGAEPDVLAFDPGWGRLYVSAESGTVSVFTEQAGRVLEHDGDLTIPHAHTVAVDPRTHLVYFPLENVSGRPLLRIMTGDKPSRGVQ